MCECVCMCCTGTVTRSTRFQLYTVRKTRVYFAQYQINNDTIFCDIYPNHVHPKHFVCVTLLVRSGNSIEYFRVESNDAIVVRPSNRFINLI